MITLSNGTKMWFKDKKLHRDYGPAVERVGNYKPGWYLDGKKFTFKQYAKKLNWTGEDVVMYKLKYY